MTLSQSPVFFGAWVKERRKALHFTQAELAQRAACSVFTVRKIESGERQPSRQLAGWLAVALEVPAQDRAAFVKVARGELVLDRLPAPSGAPAPLYPLDAGPDSPTGFIPLPPTPLIGRTTELSAMVRIFGDPQCRLLSLTGMGGIGKTRLAIEFAARHRHDFNGGVCYVSLAALNTTEAVIPVMADALGFVFSGPTDPQEQFIHYVGSRLQGAVLFVLDNLEHLLYQPISEQGIGVVQMVSEFLQKLPHVKILVTSRERLNIQGEWTYELHGLAVPPPHYAGRLEDCGSVALFLRSARRARVDFEADALQAPAIVEICQLLDGIPLAIELAAAWVALLPVQEIAREIKTNIDFLATSMHDVPDRHRSIKASFDHSWKLLSPQEREVLSKLAIFNGGFDRQAVARIAGASLPLLASLVSKSLVQRVEAGRYDLHQVIRQYACARLNEIPGGSETITCYGEYYLAYAQDRQKSLRRASQQEAVRQLADEIDNIRAAWQWAIDNQHYARLEQVVRSLGWYFEIAGLYREGIDMLALLVQAVRGLSCQDDVLQRVLGLAHIQQALLYFRKGQYDQARALYTEGLAIHRQFADCSVLAETLVFLGIIDNLCGDYASSGKLLEEALTLARACHEEWFEGYALYNLGYLASLKGHYQEGYEQMLAGLAIWRVLGDPHYIALGLNFMVSTLIELGRYEEAVAFMHESIDLCQQAKNRWGLGTAYRFMGMATTAAGQFQAAQDYFIKSLDIFSEYTTGWDVAMSLACLGEVTLKAGDLPGSRENYRQALQHAQEVKAMPIILDALLGIAKIDARTGNRADSLKLLFYVLDNPASTQKTRGLAAELVDELEKSLPESQVHAIKASVSKRSLEEILQELVLDAMI